MNQELYVGGDGGGVTIPHWSAGIVFVFAAYMEKTN